MVLTNETNEKLKQSLLRRERQESHAMATATTEVLSKLNISVENLPQKCQQLLKDLSITQAASEMVQLDPVAISLCQTRETAEKLDDEFEILKLRQKNKELQSKIDRNTSIIEQLRQDLAQSRTSLSSTEPVLDYCRQMALKLDNYEDSCRRAQAKFSTLAVPEHAMPQSLQTMAASLGELDEQAAALRRTTEEITLVNQARHALSMLKK